jgi:hypothetical protein
MGLRTVVWKLEGAVWRCATAQGRFAANLKLAKADSNIRGLLIQGWQFPRMWYSTVGHTVVFDGVS